MGKCRNINLIDSEFLASNFQRYVFDWMKDKNGRFLTRDEGEDFFDEIANKLTTLQLTWTIREHSVHMQQINIRFTKDEIELQDFLEPKNTTQLFILISMPDTILGLIQVHQILEKIPDYQKDDSYIFLRLNSFLRMQDSVVDAFASRSKRLLIIECKSIEVKEQASYRELKAMKFNNFGKIILITEKDGMPVNQFKRIFKDRYVEKRVEVNSLLDLENESREKIIKEGIVKFQGQEVPLSTLMINKESMNLINAEALAKLINNETLEIGECLEDLGDVGNYYIRRTLQRPVKINRSLSKDTSSFYVTTNNQLRDFDSQRNQDIIVISDNSELFKELSNEKIGKKHNIHWLKSENSQFIWQESNGTVSKLRKYVNSDSVETFSPEKVTEISKKIAIITAEPGMGKSTMLTHLSVQTKISEPTVWVAKINLSVDCSKKLKEMVNGGITFDDEKTIEFLLASAKFTSKMPEYQFLNYCYKTGNMILLFDGFDEISPYYNSKVIELLKFLKGTSVRKIWVTTRPYDIKTNLEDELGSFSYVLEAFSVNDQRYFLRKYWAAELNFDHFDDRRANVFIDTLLESFSKSINDSQRKFISIPLQIQMIADVCKDTFKNFYESDEENIAGLQKKLEGNLELLSLYNNFFEIKFEHIRFGEKRPDLNDANSVSRGTIKREREHVVETHEIMALENLYSNNSLIPRKKVIRLLKDIKRSENKTGIIDRVVDDKPVFIHKSFAEYFVALWFSKNWQQKNVKQLLKKRIFSKEGIVIQNFFDRMLASNELESSDSQEFSTEHPESANVYKLHNAVLNNDENEVQKLLDADESLFYKTDTAGRNLLHLAAARGHEGIARSFLEAVRKRADHNVATHPLSVEDKLLKWTPLAYADKCDHWNVAELFLQTGAAGEDMFKAIKNIVIRGIDDSGDTSLQRAAMEGYPKIAELLIKKGAVIDVRNKIGCTPLHLAATAGHLEVVHYFISQLNANSDAVNLYGCTDLHEAAENGHLGIVKYLIDERNADFEAADKLGRTVLHLAAKSGKLELVKYLVEKKNASFEIADKSGSTVLHMAAQHGRLELGGYFISEKNADFEAADKSDGHLEIVKYLIDERNADFEAADKLGRTVLHLAAENGDLKLVKYLVDEKNANFEVVNESGRTALRLAASNGNWRIVEYLVKKKNAKFEIADESEPRILHMAAQNGKLELVKYLVDVKNADFEAADESGRTALHMAAQNGKLELVKYLVEKKNASFEIADKSGSTVLHMAAQHGRLELGGYFISEKNADFEAADKSDGHLEIVKYLIDERNADFEAADKLGRAVLHLAAENGDLKLVKYLVDEKNANFEVVDESGRTALHLAAYKSNWEMVRYLVNEKNADFEAADISGRTVLHLAAYNRNWEMVRYLVDEKNADFEAADISGRRVLHFAASNRKWKMLRCLTDKKKADFEADKSGRMVLQLAVENGDLELVKFLVGEKNAYFDAVDELKRTAPHLAAENGDLELVKYLVSEKNANFEAVDESGRTVLHLAASNTNWEMVKYLVDEKNADFKAADKSGNTVLHVAARNGNWKIVKYLVDKKDADFEATDESGCTVLHLAALKKNWEMVKYLVNEKNADFEATDESGSTVLHLAASNGNWEMVKYLVDKKYADFDAADKSGCTVLHLAASNGNLKMVKYLVDEKNADLKAADKSGRTVLHSAAKNGDLDLVRYLVDEKNADFEATDESGSTVLHLAASNGNWKMVKYLVDEKEADLKAADKSGITALHAAAGNRNWRIVKYLVDEKNADLKAADKSGRTVLHSAAKNRDLNLVKYLVDEKNADLKAADKSGRTVLHLAARNGDLDLVRYLVDEKHADFEAADESGRTVLHLAAENGNLDLVRYLVDEKNADFKAADESGRTVLDIVAENENSEIVKYLVDKKC